MLKLEGGRWEKLLLPHFWGPTNTSLAKRVWDPMEAMKTAIEGSEGPQAFPAQVMKRGGDGG